MVRFIWRLILAAGLIGALGACVWAADLCERALVEGATRLASASSQILRNRDAIYAGYTLPPNFIQGYYTRRIEPYLAKTRYPEVENPQLFYRGMFVSVEDLAEVLRNGFDIEKVTWTAVGEKGVSFSSSIREASTYIFHNGGGSRPGIGVVFSVRRTSRMVLVVDPIHNPTNTIFKSAQNVPPSEIAEVYLWGRWGLEGINDVLARADSGEIQPHHQWTRAFDSLFDR